MEPRLSLGDVGAQPPTPSGERAPPDSGDPRLAALRSGTNAGSEGRPAQGRPPTPVRYRTTLSRACAQSGLSSSHREGQDVHVASRPLEGEGQSGDPPAAWGPFELVVVAAA